MSDTRDRARSWALRVAVAGGVLALAGELVRAWGRGATQASQTVNAILDQPPPGPDPAALVGDAMLGVGGAVAVIALMVWAVKRLRP